MSIIQRLLQKYEGSLQAITLAFLGDSITQGCFELYKDESGRICTVTEADAAYAKRLLEALGALYPQTAFRLINAGVSGDRAPNGAKRLARDVLAHKPDLAVVCYGLNDCGDEVGSVEKYCAALERIFLDLRASACEVVFLSPNCMNDSVSDEITDPDIRAVAQRKAVLQNGGYLTRHIQGALALCKRMAVPVCDCYAIWQEMQERGADTTALLSNCINHPTREMHALFADELLKTLLKKENDEEGITMKMVKDKYLVVGADFAGYPLKEAVVAHLREKGWKITDLGVTKQSDPNDTENMFHRVGLRVGARISEGEFERALLFCGTGMGIHIAASKCPHVHAGVVESVPAALRAITGNGVNVLAMGAFYVAPAMGCDIADAYLGAELGSGYEWWHNFYEFHKLAIDELEAFDYESYKAAGFRMEHLGDFDLKLEKKPE